MCRRWAAPLRPCACAPHAITRLTSHQLSCVIMCGRACRRRQEAGGAGAPAMAGRRCSGGGHPGGCGGVQGPPLLGVRDDDPGGGRPPGGARPQRRCHVRPAVRPWAEIGLPFCRRSQPAGWWTWPPWDASWTARLCAPHACSRCRSKDRQRSPRQLGVPPWSGGRACRGGRHQASGCAPSDSGR